MEPSLEPDTTSMASKSPLRNRTHFRVCHVRAIPPESPFTGSGVPVLEVLDLGRLADAMVAATDFAPQVMAVSSRPSLRLRGERWDHAGEIAWQRYRLLVPGGGLVDVRLLSTPWPALTDAIDLLEDLNYETIEGEPPNWDVVHVERAAEGHATELGPFHQLVFIPDDHEEPGWETTQRLVYRADLDAIEEQSSIKHPDELNRRPGQLAAVGRFGSVLWGLQDYLEASLVVSAALTVSAAATLRTVQRAARSHLLTARSLLTGGDGDDLDPGELQRTVTALGIDLAIGAEAQANIVDLLPSLRVDAFHQALYDAADLRPQIALATSLLKRIEPAAQPQAKML